MQGNTLRATNAGQEAVLESVSEELGIIAKTANINEQNICRSQEKSCFSMRGWTDITKCSILEIRLEKAYENIGEDPRRG